MEVKEHPVPSLIMGCPQQVVQVWDMKKHRVTEGLTLPEESGLGVLCITQREGGGKL